MLGAARSDIGAHLLPGDFSGVGRRKAAFEERSTLSKRSLVLSRQALRRIIRMCNDDLPHPLNNRGKFLIRLLRQDGNKNSTESIEKKKFKVKVQRSQLKYPLLVPKIHDILLPSKQRDNPSSPLASHLVVSSITVIPIPPSQRKVNHP